MKNKVDEAINEAKLAMMKSQCDEYIEQELKAGRKVKLQPVLLSDFSITCPKCKNKFEINIFHQQLKNIIDKLEDDRLKKPIDAYYKKLEEKLGDHNP